MGTWKNLRKEATKAKLEHEDRSEDIWITCCSQASWMRMALKVHGVIRRRIAVLIGIWKYPYTTMVHQCYTTQNTFRNSETS